LIARLAAFSALLAVGGIRASEPTGAPTLILRGGRVAIATVVLHRIRTVPTRAPSLSSVALVPIVGPRRSVRFGRGVW
jgi:hypothetical protein